MKTVTALPAPALLNKLRVKKILVKGIIYLTSEKFVTFVGVIAALGLWWGVCTENADLIFFSAIVWLISFMPWAWRHAARSIRQERLNLMQW